MGLININKHIEYFDPHSIKDSIHIIGCGAIGSHIGISLARLGVSRIYLYDFDIVEDHNIANQAYDQLDIGRPKTEALAKKMLLINPSARIKIKEKYTDQHLLGYVFLCVDNIETRRKIVESNPQATFFDTRMGLEEGQSYAGPNLLSSMQFTEDEAQVNQPVSACNMTLSILPLVWSITSATVAQFINTVNNKPVQNAVFINAFKHITTTI